MSQKKDLSPFAQSALNLDGDFLELERLSSHIESLSLTSESELRLTRKLLAEFSECSLRIGSGVQALAQTLDEARTRAERGVGIVAARAAAIQELDGKNETLMGRFQTLGQMVGEISAAIAQLPTASDRELNPEEKAVLQRNLPELNVKLGELIVHAQNLKQDARVTKNASLQRDADSLGQRLQSIHNKLNAFLGSAQMIGESSAAPTN